jgi:hypothetical protein
MPWRCEITSGEVEEDGLLDWEVGGYATPGIQPKKTSPQSS